MTGPPLQRQRPTETSRICRFFPICMHLASHEKILDLAMQKRLRTSLKTYRTQTVFFFDHIVEEQFNCIYLCRPRFTVMAPVKQEIR
jgi:hypothetical protein